jgi:hypothetical protein
VPGCRYAVGKGEGCEIVVDGAMPAAGIADVARERVVGRRRWIDQRNSRRVGEGVVARCHQALAERSPAIEHPARGWSSEHTKASRGTGCRCVGRSPAAAEAGAASPTPVTPIAPPRRREGVDHHGPHGIGRPHRRHSCWGTSISRRSSRNQALVIDWAHAEVSGRHFEIVALDESGAQIVVHGDNGVAVDGTSHGPGTQFKWKPGETLLLGGGAGQAFPCTLTLSQTA